MPFMLPIEPLGPAVRPGVEQAAKGARANGTRFIRLRPPSNSEELLIATV